MRVLARILSVASALIFWAACSQPPSTEAAPAAGPLQGVWSVVTVEPSDGPAADPAQPGLYIFGEEYYSAVYAPGAEPRTKSAVSFTPTPDEMIAQYQSIIVNSGTYELQGAAFTLRPIIAKSPGFVGGHLAGTFSLSGDTLVLRHEHLFDRDGVELVDFGEVLTLVRLE